MAAWSSSDIRLAELRRRWEEAPTSHLFLQLAEEYRRRGQTEQALDVLRRGMPSTPSVAAEVALGRCLLESGAPAEAKEHLKEAVRRDPTQMVAYRHLVETHLQLGEGDDARHCLEIYRQLNAHDVDLMVLAERVEHLLATQTTSVETASVPMAGFAQQSSQSAPSEVLQAPPSVEDSGSARLPALAPISDTARPAIETSVETSGRWEQAGPSNRQAARHARFKPGSPQRSASRLRQVAPFQLEPIDPGGFDLRALPLRPLRQRPGSALTATGGVVSLPEHPPASHPSHDQPTSDAVSGTAPGSGNGGHGLTATLGKIYLEQGHTEDAAQIYSKVHDGSGTEAVRTLEESVAPERCSSPLPIASFVPLPLLRSRRSVNDRRLLVVEAYLQRLSEAKRHVS